jgi:hypothetical protein
MLNKEFVKIISDLKAELPEIYEEISTLKMSYLKGWVTDNFENELTHNRRIKILIVVTHLLDHTEVTS